MFGETLTDETRVGISAVADDQSAHVRYGGVVLRIITDPFSRLWSATVALLVVAAVVMGTSDVPAGLIAASLAVVASHTVVGVRVFDSLTHGTGALVERLGVGAALGSLLAMTWDQLLVSTPLQRWSWLVFPLAAAAVLVTTLRRRTSAPPRTPESVPMVNVVTLLTLTYLLLVQERYWPLPVALSLIPLAVAVDRRHQIRQGGAVFTATAYAVAIAIAGAVAAVTLRARPPLWWIKTQDYQFFEALSFSLAHWGSRDQVFVTGYPVYYHWFSYAWTGMLRRVIDAPEWIVLTRIAPVFVVVCVALLVLAIARRCGVPGKAAAGVVVVFALLTDLNFESFSMVFSYVWLLAFAIIAIRFLDDGLTSVSWLGPLLAAGSFGAKSSNAPLIVAVVACVVIVAWWRDRSAWRRPLVFGLAHAVALLVIFERLYLRSAYSEGIEIGTIGIARDLFGDIGKLTPIRMLLASLVVFVNLVAVHVLAVARGRRVDGTWSAITVVMFGALAGSLPFLLLSWSNDYEQEEYFLHAMSALTSIIVGTIVVHFLAQSARRKWWPIAVVATGVLWWWNVAPRPNEGTYTAIFARVISDSTAAVLLIFGALVIVVARTFGTRFSASGTLQFLLVFIASVIPLNQRWFLRYDNFVAEVNTPGHEEFVLGRRDVIEGALLVRNNTPRDAIIMSNHFCERPICALADYGPHRSNWKRGGEAMTLTVYSQRRFWVNGYGFLWQNVEPSVEIRRRMADSLGPSAVYGEGNYYLRDSTAPGPSIDTNTTVARSTRFVLYSL